MFLKMPLKTAYMVITLTLMILLKIFNELLFCGNCIILIVLFCNKKNIVSINIYFKLNIKNLYNIIH